MNENLIKSSEKHKQDLIFVYLILIWNPSFVLATFMILL